MGYSNPKTHVYRVHYDESKDKWCCRIGTENGKYTIGIGWGGNPGTALLSADVDKSIRAARNRYS